MKYRKQHPPPSLCADDNDLLHDFLLAQEREHRGGVGLGGGAELDGPAFGAGDRNGLKAHCPQRRTITVVPGLPACACTPCQPSGRNGVVQKKSHRAALGPRFTQPWLRGRPKPWCQNAPCSA